MADSIIAKLDCALVAKVSKDGEPYNCLIIRLTKDYDKIVYLDRAEKEIMKLYSESIGNTSSSYNA